MARGKFVTRDLVERVKEFNKRCPDMSPRDMERITGIASDSTIYRILSGDYDHLLDEPPCDGIEGDASIEDIASNLERIARTLDDNHRLLRAIVDALECD